MLFPVTRFQNRFDRKPVAEEASWEHFCHRFKDRTIRPDKDGALFSPAKYADSTDGYRVESFIKKEGRDIGKVWVNNANEKLVTDPKLVRIARHGRAVNRSLGESLGVTSLRDLTPEQVFVELHRREHTAAPEGDLLAAFAELVELAHRRR